MIDQASRRPGAEAASARGHQRAEEAPPRRTVLLEDDLEQVAAAGSNTIRAGQEGN
jgi:hypothetical protein